MIRKLLTARWLRSGVTAITWLVLMCGLFVLPGSAFPKENWLTAIYFDKWVHTGLFLGLTFLWSAAFGFWAARPKLLLLLSFVFGVLVEVVQGLFVPNRSFDPWDVVTDMTGALLGLWLYRWVYKKNKPL